ncbi:MAG: hypothetical protein Kow0092_16130 [Deferrisomatales bacterium]
MRKGWIGAVCAVSLLLPALAGADNLARDYTYAPPGTFLMLWYDYHVSAHKFYNDGKIVTKDLDASGDVYIFRPVYYHSYGFLGLEGAQQVLFFAKDIEVGSSRISGLSDMLYSPAIWFYKNKTNRTLLGFIPHLTIPIGEYDKDRPASSAGDNRWKIQPELNFTWGATDKLYAEITGAVQFFEDNDDWVGGSKLEQDPLYTVELHLSYDISPAWWVAADYYWHGGGETKVDGVDQNDDQNNHTLGGSLAFGLAPSYQLIFSYQHDIEVDAGPKYQTMVLRFMYVF